jgi:hypothetical protein
MRTNYARGREKEYQAKDELEKMGFTCVRMAGSHGQFDLISWDEHKVRMIQCKREKDKTKKICTPDTNYPEDAKKIKETKTPHYVTKELWIWVDRVGWKKFELQDKESLQYWKVI